MGSLNLLIQVIGLGTGIYLAIARNIWTGLALIAIVFAGHFIFTQMSKLLMYVHQKQMSSEELESMRIHVANGDVVGGTPRAWKLIANGCGVAYFLSTLIFILLYIKG